MSRTKLQPAKFAATDWVISAKGNRYIIASYRGSITGERWYHCVNLQTGKRMSLPEATLRPMRSTEIDQLAREQRQALINRGKR